MTPVAHSLTSSQPARQRNYCKTQRANTSTCTERVSIYAASSSPLGLASGGRKRAFVPIGPVLMQYALALDF